jgi:hypothetical protein
LDIVTSTTNYQTARATLGAQLNSLLNSFGITLPALSAQGTVTQSAMNALYATAAAAYPQIWTSAIATQINGLLTAMGYLATVLMPLVMTGIANASGSSGVTVSTAVTFPNALPNTSYMVVVDAGQNVGWYITSKTTTGCTVNLTVPTGSSVAAGTFNIMVVN